jgi:hypothetical protein
MYSTPKWERLSTIPPSSVRPFVTILNSRIQAAKYPFWIHKTHAAAFLCWWQVDPLGLILRDTTRWSLARQHSTCWASYSSSCPISSSPLGVMRRPGDTVELYIASAIMVVWIWGNCYSPALVAATFCKPTSPTPKLCSNKGFVYFRPRFV